MASKLIIKGVSDKMPEVEQETEQAVDMLPSEQPKAPVLSEPPMKIDMLMRRGLDGRLMIYEHDHIDIVFLPEKMKLVAFAKKDFSDIIYETQNRLFEFLVKKGLCSPEHVRGGNVYGSIESLVLKPKEEMPVEHLLVLNIKKWLDSERPALQADKEYEEKYSSMLTDPDAEDSTNLGEVPHEEEKGSIPKSDSRRYIGGWW